MNVHFSKYHGTGNDFILIDGRNFDIGILTEDVINFMCHRNLGIGADGLIILLESEHSDFRMMYFNADGKEGSMCGNGGRCITAFAHSLGIINKEARFEGIDGLHRAYTKENGEIRLELKDVEGIRMLEDGMLLDTGSPHYVRFVEDPEQIDVEKEGKNIRHEARFEPEGVNVNFVWLMPDQTQIKVRTYERGVEAETLSCGTGVSAAAISAYRERKTDNFSLNTTQTFRIETPGGHLQVSFREIKENVFTDLFLEGPARHVFDGVITI